jgi:hypothetical protein
MLGPTASTWNFLTLPSGLSSLCYLTIAERAPMADSEEINGQAVPPISTIAGRCLLPMKAEDRLRVPSREVRSSSPLEGFVVMGAAR